MGPELIVYGDFNCPFSRLASARIVTLEEQGKATGDWRAVEHDRSIPAGGLAVTGEVDEELRRELEQVHGMLAQGERDPLRLPSVRVNTRRAIETYAGADEDSRSALRERIFAAYWEENRDIGDADTLLDLGAGGANQAVAARWRDEWLELPRIVPVMVMPDGYVSRGLGALARLARLAG